MICSKWLATCLIILGLILFIQEIDGGRSKGGGKSSSSSGRGSSSGRSSSSSGRSSSSSGRSSSSSGRSSSSSSKSSSQGIQPTPTRNNYKSSSLRKVPTTRKSHVQAAKPYTPRPNSYNSRAQTTRKGQPSNQFAQPYTPRPNSFNSRAQTTRRGQIPTPRSYGQYAQPYTPRSNPFNAGSQQGQYGQPGSPWQANKGINPTNQYNPQSWTQNSNFQKHPQSWQTGNIPNNGLQPGSFNQYQPGQQSRPWQTGNNPNYGMQPGQSQWGQSWNSQPNSAWQQPGQSQWGQNWNSQPNSMWQRPGQPQWGQSWNSQPNSAWQQPGQPINMNQFSSPQSSGGLSNAQKMFTAANGVMTMYNLYHTVQSFKSRQQNPGQYRPTDPYYGSSNHNYRPNDPYSQPDAGQDIPHGYDGWRNSSTTPENTTLPQHDHYWCPEPSNMYDDFYNYSSDSVSIYEPSNDGCCHGKMFSFKQSRKRNCCETKEYDPTFHVCCGNKTHYKRNEFTCCGSEYYNYEESLCCFKPMEGPVVVRLPFDIRMNSVRKQNTQCCGEQLFDTETQVCCGIQTQTSYNFSLFQKIYGGDTRCCNGKMINGRAQFCQNLPPPLPESAESSNGAQYPQFVGICDNELYNPREKICCTLYNYTNEILTHTHFLFNKTTETTACCDSNTYDTKTELCCYGEVVGNATGKGCCGRNAYDLATHWCCLGTNITTLSNVTAEEDGCCGDTKLPYSSKKQMCCGNSVFDIPNLNETYRHGCCISNDSAIAKTMDRYSEVCCDGVVHKINGTFHQECCGKELIDVSKSFCCSGKVIPKERFTECCNGKQIYNITTHICCNSKIIGKPSKQHTACCGNLPFDERKEICCYNPTTEVAKVEPRRSPWMQCCDTKPFDEATQICCENEVIDRNGSRVCCMQFDPLIPRMTHLVIKKTNPNSFCCGLKLYNPDIELCCNLTIIPMQGHSDALCCGSVMYRSERELCCNGVVQQKKYINSACCGKKAYSADFDMCCGNVIIWKGTKKDPTCCFPGMEDV